MVETQEAVIRITPLAAEKAKEILARYGKEHAAIRVYIKSGGCSGFQYGMAVDERELPGDTFVEMHGVRLVVDRMSLPYLVGSEIDWVESLMGGGFTVHNPNAVSTCGCGHSFRTKDQEGTPRACGHWASASPRGRLVGASIGFRCGGPLRGQRGLASGPFSFGPY